jgi:hypothetical protein
MGQHIDQSCLKFGCVAGSLELRHPLTFLL